MNLMQFRSFTNSITTGAPIVVIDDEGKERKVESISEVITCSFPKGPDSDKKAIHLRLGV